MAHRQISVGFWSDTKVEDFTPEEKFLFLYCLTSPHTNLCGCYEISVRQIANETGLCADDVTRLLGRLEQTHNVLRYDAQTRELLVLNWHRYNWTASSKLDKPLLAEIRRIKCPAFRGYVAALYNGRASVAEPYMPEEDAAVVSPPARERGRKERKKPGDGAEDAHEPDGAVEKPDSAGPPPTEGPEAREEPGGPRASGEDYIRRGTQKKQDVFSKFAGDDAELLNELREFEAMRRKIKKPLTERAKELLLKKLQEFPAHEWTLILQQSIRNSWQGIFPLDGAKDHGARHGGGGSMLDVYRALDAQFAAEDGYGGGP